MLAFQVFVACHDTSPAFKVCRSVSRLMSVIALSRNTSTSFDGLHVENGQPRSRGSTGDLADPITRRLIGLRRPAPAPFWVQGVHALVVEVMDHLPHIRSDTCSSFAINGNPLMLRRSHHHDPAAPGPAVCCAEPPGPARGPT
ncbi:hypothetical protein ACFZC5_34715 [Nocardia gamkensis]|uniref:hypothetical protein n=1 Tax=Nocardia gamkensis TaxID=352869 RepID=UPI0036EA10A2